MNLVHHVRRVSVLVAASAFVAIAAQSHAQEIAESHLKAARATIAAVNVTDAYDNILPAAAMTIKQQLIQQNPDLTDVIISTTDEKTIALAGRRADLEREAALAYARVFSEAELNAIAAFYVSDAGKKLLAEGPIVSREVAKAADIWQRGVSRDLATEVGNQISKIVDEEVAADKAKAAVAAPTPAEGADASEPAADGAAPTLEGLDKPVQ